MLGAPKSLLAGAAGCAVLVSLLAVLALESSWVRSVDTAALRGFVGLQGPHVSPIASDVAALADIVPYGIFSAAIVGFAFLRGVPARGLAAGALLAAAGLSSQILQRVLAETRPEGYFDGATEGAHVNADAFPSGHATASMALALAALLVAPSRRRPLVAACGVLFVLAVTFSILEKGWHFPTDVIAGYLLTAGWALAVVAALHFAGAAGPDRTASGRAAIAVRRTPARRAAVGLGATVLAAAVAVAAAAVALASGRIPDSVTDTDGGTFLWITGTIAAAAAALVATVAGLVGRRY
jgi:membrane-associated phospholipid phosphatase